MAEAVTCTAVGGPPSKVPLSSFFLVYSPSCCQEQRSAWGNDSEGCSLEMPSGPGLKCLKENGESYGSVLYYHIIGVSRENDSLRSVGILAYPETSLGSHVLSFCGLS